MRFSNNKVTVTQVWPNILFRISQVKQDNGRKTVQMIINYQIYPSIIIICGKSILWETISGFYVFHSPQKNETKLLSAEAEYKSCFKKFPEIPRKSRNAPKCSSASKFAEIPGELRWKLWHFDLKLSILKIYFSWFRKFV